MDSLNNLTDEVLVNLYAKGNNNAFDILLMRYKRKVFSYILLTVKDRDVADDIFQDTFIKVISKIRHNNYEEKGKFSAWILRIAHNLVIDYFRRLAASKTISGESSNEEEPNLFDSVPVYDTNIEEVLIDQQIKADVVRLVDSLPSAQREVLRMRFYQGLSFQEIAESSGVSINTALGRMRYALINLRRLVVEKNISLVS